jgi:hypothetical protein
MREEKKESTYAYAAWEQKRQRVRGRQEDVLEDIPFHARCPECQTMQYATRVFARALQHSKKSGGMIVYDCGHSTGYTYAQLSRRSPIYILLAEEAEETQEGE